MMNITTARNVGYSNKSSNNIGEEYESDPFTHRVEVNGRFKTYLINPGRVAEMFPGYIKVIKKGEERPVSVSGVMITDAMNKNEDVSYDGLHGEKIVIKRGDK